MSNRREIRFLKAAFGARGGRNVFTLVMPDGEVKEIIAPGANRPMLNWLLERMDNPSHPDSVAIRAATSWCSSCGGDLLSLIRCSDNVEQRQARGQEIVQVAANRKLQLIELGLAEEEPQPVEAPAEAPEPEPKSGSAALPDKEPEPDDTGNVIAFPPPPEGWKF